MKLIDKVIMIIILLVLLVAGFYFIFVVAEPTSKNILIQNEIRGCCHNYRVAGCRNEGSIYCTTDYLLNLILEIDMSNEQLRDFCGCG